MVIYKKDHLSVSMQCNGTVTTSASQVSNLFVLTMAYSRKIDNGVSLCNISSLNQRKGVADEMLSPSLRDPYRPAGIVWHHFASTNNSESVNQCREDVLVLFQRQLVKWRGKTALLRRFAIIAKGEAFRSVRNFILLGERHDLTHITCHSPGNFSCFQD